MFTVVQNSFPNCCTSVLRIITRKCTTTALSETENVIYPPILDLSRSAVIKRKKERWHEKIKNLESVEEKIFGINMPHYYGWKSLNLQEGNVPYNSLDHAQYITRTHIMNERKLPDFYDTANTTEQLDTLVQTVKHHVENIVKFEYCHRLREHEITEVESKKKKLLHKAVTDSLVYQINRIILAALSPTMPHLLEAQVDFKPRVEAFWFAGGIDPSDLRRKARLNLKHMKQYADEPIDMPVHYVGSPILHLRHQFPLKEIISLTESTNEEFNVPQFKFYPKVLGYSLSNKHAACIPGFWPGDVAEFGLLSYHNLNNVFFRSVPWDDDAIKVQAIFASYGWLLSQACYQGFSTVNDITYPLVSQTVLTSGQYWSFCVYQLNTTILHSEYADENPKRNVCWISEPMKLFEEVKDGVIHGFNEDVLKKLLTFYINSPVERSNVNMKPYLGESVKHVADITEPARRTWLEEKFKHLMTNRPRHFKEPEVYHWQKLYLIDNKTRPMDKRRDPWQFGYNSYKRRLDDCKPPYVPKCLRENPKKKKIGRTEKTYYPDA